MDGEFSSAELDAGRRLFAGEWTFATAASSLKSLPAMAAPEIAFAGRSNVGKSSLINALTGRKALARTSNTPGRTQELIFFQGPVFHDLKFHDLKCDGPEVLHGPEFNGPKRLVLVDMPGYGYAATAKTKIAAWTALIHDYLRGRATLARVYILIDARHGLKSADDAILDTLSKAAVSHEIVLTKSDQVGEAELSERIDTVKSAIRKRPAAFPDVIATSSHTAAGIADLRAAIARLLIERGDMQGRKS
jgi:GTP-binding protein